VLTRSLAVIAFIMAMLPLTLPTATAAKHAWPTCENFLNQADAQAAYDADPSDPFKLTAKSSGAPCDGTVAFGAQPLVSCDALDPNPDARSALQGLLAATAAGGDPYGLDPDGNGAACDQSGGAGDTEPLDMPQSATPEATSSPDTGKVKKAKNGGNTSTDTGATAPAPPPSDTTSSTRTPSITAGNGVVVSAPSGGSAASGESLGARLEARFAELEAQFAAFSGDDDTASSRGNTAPITIPTGPSTTTTSGTGALPGLPSTTSTSTGATTAARHGHHHGHGKGHGKHHKGHNNGKHHKNGHKHH
jgi:hypothetical protein